MTWQVTCLNCGVFNQIQKGEPVICPKCEAVDIDTEVVDGEQAAETYKINVELSLPVLANPRFASLSIKEECRIIGGDKGDLRFYGYTLDRDNDKTILDNPELITSLDLTEDEANDIAVEVLMFSYASIGAETVEHN